jgi:hypothetical protein
MCPRRWIISLTRQAQEPMRFEGNFPVLFLLDAMQSRYQAVRTVSVLNLQRLTASLV